MNTLYTTDKASEKVAKLLNDLWMNAIDYSYAEGGSSDEAYYRNECEKGINKVLEIVRKLEAAK